MKVRILLAEDNPDHAFLTVRALRGEDADIDVDTVTDGAQALAYLRRHGAFADRETPHLVLLDLKMPVMGGLEVLERVKGDPSLRTIPTVVLSSSDRPEDIVASYRLGANSYVPKPGGPSGLRQGVHGIAEYWIRLACLPEPTD